MAEETSFGVARLRQAITNQATCGNGQFELSIDSADKLCREIEAELENLSWDEDELARLSWAKDVPAPRDAGGEVVPLDTSELYTDDGEIVYVNNIRFNGCTWFVGVENSYKLYWLNRLHTTERDSWALLEKNILTLAKCKFLADPEGDSKECIRRAKALAERDAKEASRD